MAIEFNFTLGRNKEEMIKKLESRGLEYNEANNIAEIIFNAERYKTQAFTVKAQLEVLHEILENGNIKMSNIGGTAGPHYGELKRKIKELERLE